jgi:hypothetical protein
MWSYLFETYAGKNRSRINSGIKALAVILLWHQALRIGKSSSTE